MTDKDVQEIADKCRCTLNGGASNVVLPAAHVLELINRWRDLDCAIGVVRRAILSFDMVPTDNVIGPDNAFFPPA